MRASATITTLCCLTLLSGGAADLATPAQQAVDTAQLDEVEDLSESLANDLLALSLATRDKDRAAIERYFDDPLDATPFPTVALPATRVAAWAVSREWRIDAIEPVGRDTFV